MVDVARALSRAQAPLWTSQPLPAWGGWPDQPPFQPLELLAEALRTRVFPRGLNDEEDVPLSTRTRPSCGPCSWS